MLEERQGSSEEKIFKAHLLPKEDGEKATPGEGQAAEAGFQSFGHSRNLGGYENNLMLCPLPTK